MPPAISSDEEASDVEAPAAATPNRSGRGRNAVKYQEPEPLEMDEDEEMAKEEPNGKVKDDDDEEEEGEGGEEEDEEEAEEYVVEKILSHRWEKGENQLRFEVKWEGYEKKSDRTWEPEENLMHTSVLNEYYEAHGGKEKMVAEAQFALKNKKRGRQQSDTPTTANKRSRKNGDHPGDTTPPLAKQVAWKPPTGTWEDDVVDLDACEDEDTGKLMVYLTWKDGHKTQHETSVVYKRCPQKMLQFYERHVRIIKKDPDELTTDPVL